jgi:ribonucleoside-triphosphate reductase
MPSNCLLINLEDMFANGFVLNKILIEAPKSFQTACNLMSQVIFSIGGQVYGGKTVNLSHLAPYLKLTNEKIKRTYPESLREREYKKALRDGIQTINYQVQTLESGADGQAVFCTFFLETHTGDRYINDIVEEVLRQRII